MNYEQAVAYLFEQLPMFQRIGAAAYKEDLHNTIRLMDHLDHPYRRFKSVHVAGTNGKGSTSHMLAAVFQKAGYKTGLYTSPHLKSFRERIKINGEEISETFIADFVTQHHRFFSSFDPSFFEITVAMAFQYFAEEEVDIAIIETGLGGRLDSTNVITPELSVITNIGWDHMNLLGNTLEKIAGEKAGIIKENVPVVVGQRQENIAYIFEERAKEKNSSFRFADDLYKVESYDWINADRLYLDMEVKHVPSGQMIPVETDLPGLYQLKNVPAVLSALAVLADKGYRLPGLAVWEGLKHAASITGLRGRWEILQNDPTVIADTGHNKDGLEMVLKQLATYSYKKLRMVVGFVNDKEIDGLLRMLPEEAEYYFTQASIPRALPVGELVEKANTTGLSGTSYPNVPDALKAAVSESDPNDLIFVGGSTFVVADVM